MVAHSWVLVTMMLLRPELPEVADTQYRLRNSWSPCNAAR